MKNIPLFIKILFQVYFSTNEKRNVVKTKVEKEFFIVLRLKLMTFCENRIRKKKLIVKLL